MQLIDQGLETSQKDAVKTINNKTLTQLEYCRLILKFLKEESNPMQNREFFEQIYK